MDKVFCLMLVEGPYDRQRLSVLTSLFNEDKLVLVPYGTDVLTTKDYYLNYEHRIKEVLAKEKTNDFEDFDEIVQVCDTDGCFVDDQYVVTDKLIRHVVYEKNLIKVVDDSSVLFMRATKRDNINHLLKENKIKLYYNSTNIDHTFDGIQNPTDGQKRSKAVQMYLKYKNDGENFIKELVRLSPTLDGYEDSWNYIKQGFNSLSQCSNLLYFVIDHYDSLKDEYKAIIDELYNK